MADATAKPLMLASDQVTVPATSVSVYEAIYRRRTVWQYQNDEPVPRETVQRLLGAAAWVPNHRITEPWRFFVVEKGSQARKQVAELAYDFVVQTNGTEQRATGARQLILDNPVLIFEFSVAGPNEEVTRENYAAACCAVQNIYLAAHAEGLGVGWRTGGAMKHPRLNETLGAGADWQPVAMLSIGVPAQVPAGQRTPVNNFITWLA